MTQCPICKGSGEMLYFDEDGELAHEFYEEVLPKKKGGARKMRRVNSRNLVPQVSSYIERRKKLFIAIFLAVRKTES